MSISFVIPGDPVGKGRPRFVRATGHAYTPKKTADYEARVRAAYPGTEVSEAQLSMRIDAYFGIPKSKSKKEKELMLQNAIRPMKKPDMDNVVKIIADALNGVAYKDDVQVVEVACRKWYAADPRVEVTIEEIERMEESDGRNGESKTKHD